MMDDYGCWKVLAASGSSLGVQLGARQESKHFLQIVSMGNLHSNDANALLKPHTDARKASSKVSGFFFVLSNGCLR